MRFLPTSSAMTTPISKMRWSMISAALRTRATRSCQGVRLQAGKALRAAASASCASCAVPFWNTPSTTSVLAGERSSNFSAAKRSLPSMIMAYSLPRLALTFASASSKRVCSSSGGLNMVA